MKKIIKLLFSAFLLFSCNDNNINVTGSSGSYSEQNYSFEPVIHVNHVLNKSFESYEKLSIFARDLKTTGYNGDFNVAFSNYYTDYFSGVFYTFHGAAYLDNKKIEEDHLKTIYDSFVFGIEYYNTDETDYIIQELNIYFYHFYNLNDFNPNEISMENDREINKKNNRIGQEEVQYDFYFKDTNIIHVEIKKRGDCELPPVDIDDLFIQIKNNCFVI